MLQSKDFNIIELPDKNKPQGIVSKTSLLSLPQGNTLAINRFFFFAYDI